MVVELISPEGTLYSETADSVTLPGGDGELTILRGHLPLLSTLVPGTVIIRKGGEEFYFAVTRGALQVTRGMVRVLVDTADRVEGLDEGAIERAKAKAEELLREKRTSDAEGYAQARATLERELARQMSARRLRARSRFRSS